MPSVFTDRLTEVNSLLLRPTAENVLRVTSCLESLAEDVARVRCAWLSGISDEETNGQVLSDVREQILRARELLTNAARFYNAFSATAEVASYERHGFVCIREAPRRALARL